LGSGAVQPGGRQETRTKKKKLGKRVLEKKPGPSGRKREKEQKPKERWKIRERKGVKTRGGLGVGSLRAWCVTNVMEEKELRESKQ